jgi:hypothetical protein
MIDNNADQDEWTNSLTLGSCWVNVRDEAWYDTRYDTGYKVRNWQRSLDTKSSWIPKFTNQESRHKVGLKSRRLRTKITPKPVRITYWEISSSSTESTRIRTCLNLLRRNQVVFVFVKYGPTRIFSQYFQSDNKVMKFLISYRTSDIIGRLD